MNKRFVLASLVCITLGLGAQAAVAGHYGQAAKSGYSAGYGMPPGYAFGPGGYGYHEGHRPGHWGPPKRAMHRHKHAWSKKHGCDRGAYRSKYGHGYAKPGDKTAAYAPANQAPAAGAHAAAQAEAEAGEPRGQAPVPATPANIVETAVSAEGFTTLVSAVEAAGLVETLSGVGPFTVFAPTDAAFKKLPEGTVASLLGDPDALARVLTYHVVAGRLSAADLLQKREFETVNGATLDLSQLAVAQADVAAANGVIHVIDEVLLPPGS